jgi:hypothetical protein
MGKQEAAARQPRGRFLQHDSLEGKASRRRNQTGRVCLPTRTATRPTRRHCRCRAKAEPGTTTRASSGHQRLKSLDGGAGAVHGTVCEIPEKGSHDIRSMLAQNKEVKESGRLVQGRRAGL